MKYFIILFLFLSCGKLKTDNQSLLENKTWYLYKEVLNNQTYNYSKQYWLRAEGGMYNDYDKYPGTYQIKKDTFRIYFFNYGYETYYIDQVDKDQLTLSQRDTKGVVYRKLFFRN